MLPRETDTGERGCAVWERRLTLRAPILPYHVLGGGPEQQPFNLYFLICKMGKYYLCTSYAYKQQIQIA